MRTNQGIISQCWILNTYFSVCFVISPISWRIIGIANIHDWLEKLVEVISVAALTSKDEIERAIYHAGRCNGT